MRTLIFCIYLLLMVPVWWAFLGGFTPVLAFIAWEAKARAKPGPAGRATYRSTRAPTK